MVEPGRARGRRRATLALPGIEPDVMVVATGRDERRPPAIPLDELEAQHAAVEGQRAVEVGDPEVDVPDSSSGIDGPGAWLLVHERPHRTSLPAWMPRDHACAGARQPVVIAPPARVRGADLTHLEAGPCPTGSRPPAQRNERRAAGAWWHCSPRPSCSACRCGSRATRRDRS